jgi:hypothetical protein
MKDQELNPVEVTFWYGGSKIFLFSVSGTNEITKTANVPSKMAQMNGEARRCSIL